MIKALYSLKEFLGNSYHKYIYESMYGLPSIEIIFKYLIIILVCTVRVDFMLRWYEISVLLLSMGINIYLHKNFQSCSLQK